MLMKLAPSVCHYTKRRYAECRGVSHLAATAECPVELNLQINYANCNLPTARHKMEKESENL